MTEEEKPSILKDYIFIKDIGEGNFGKVKLSKSKTTNEKFAIKILDKGKLKSQTKSTLFNEIEIISKLKHPNIIYVYNILEDEKNYYIIMEYCEKGELFDYIVEKERLDTMEASLFFYQLINGVEYIHKQGFSHRDLKPENLLLTKDKMLKIIDFGLCHDFDENKALHTKCGSPSYAAPEILKGFPYNGFKTDIWCCGIILYAMLCGYLPFDGDDNQEIFQSIVECEPEFPSFLEEDIIILLLCLLNPEPKDRITIEEIKQHPFYLKGKHLYSIQYEGNDDTFIDEGKDDEIKNNNFMNSNTVEKKGIAFSTIRRKKGSIYTFNNIKNLRMKENKNKNNIYQNIFGNNNNEEECVSPRLVIKDEKKKNNDEIEKNNSKEKSKNINLKAIDNQKKISQIINTEISQDKSSSLIVANNLKNRTCKKDSSFIRNNENNKITINSNDAFNPNVQSHNLSQGKNHINNHNNFINAISLENKKCNQYKSFETRKTQKTINKNNNNFLNKKNIIVFKNKNKDTQNFKDIKDIKDKRLQTEQLDFFQKFCINKNRPDSIEPSPRKTIGANCKLVLTKRKDKNNEIYKNEDIIGNNKKKMSIKDRIILTQKRDKKDYLKNEAILNNKLNIINSPAQNINDFYQRNIRKNKFLNSGFGYNINKNEKKGKIDEENIEKNNYGCKSCSIKKEHLRRNLKIDLNKNININNLKIVNSNVQSHTIRKEPRNNNFINKIPQDININNNLLSLNIVVRTDQRNNHFLDKVIQKLNINKDRKSVKNHLNIIMSNNDFKNDENKQIFRFTSVEKNKDEYFLNPFFVNNYYKNSINEDDKNYINFKSPIHSKEEKLFLHTLNPKMEGNSVSRKSKDRVKKIFPNLTIYKK